MDVDMEERYKITGKKKYYHVLNKEAQKYFDSVSEFGNLPNTKQVVFDIYFFGLQRMRQDFQNFRSANYRLINDRTFEVL